MDAAALEALPIIDMEDLKEIFGSEEQAVMILGMFDMTMKNKSELYLLLDAVLYEDGDAIKAWAHKVKGVAGYVSAKRTKALAEIVQNAGRDKDIELAKEKFGDLIREIQKAHRKALEILETPEEEIETTMKDAYDLLRVYTKESEPEEHVNIQELVDSYGDLEMGFGMLDKGLQNAFESLNFFERSYKYLMEKSFHELREVAHKLKGCCLYICATKLVAVSDQLKVAAREVREEECYQYLIDVLEECLFMERYIMIKKLQSDEPRERMIHLRQELLDLIERKDDIPGAMEYMKENYKPEQEEKAPEAEEINQPEENHHQENLEENHENQEAPEILEIQEIQEPQDNRISLENIMEIKSPETRKSLDDIKKTVPSIKSVLEPIPEEKEKTYPEEEGKREPPKSSSEASPEKITSFRGKTPSISQRNRLLGSSDSPHHHSPHQTEKGKSFNYDETNIPVLNDSRLNLQQQDKEEIKETQEVISPVPLQKNTSRATTENNEANGKEVAAPEPKQESIIKEKSNPVKIISSKKKKIKEEQVTDDDYPFDSGLKCNIF